MKFIEPKTSNINLFGHYHGTEYFGYNTYCLEVTIPLGLFTHVLLRAIEYGEAKSGFKYKTCVVIDHVHSDRRISMVFKPG